MDLGLFSAKIEIQIKELPDVTFFCTRPRLEDMETSSSATSKRNKNLWENHHHRCDLAVDSGIRELPNEQVGGRKRWEDRVRKEQR